MQLRKLAGRRKLAVERFSRLVKTIWPRSQVKLYGSYVSGLCLPSSDLDFVVCLPAVHKKVLALAPGVLEGRNAINETSQKLLARELKGESWIDPRSIKLIERTVVPVIKVSTKDTRARMIQLDISFDSPEHHGLEANQMVARILEELPLIRPLMLVLKQFLLDRGLLTAYSGGLSSYCLFLMVARYLQEQPPSSGDCGSLLMGFLDFYGNCFDPRVTGISVRSRRYFARANHVVAGYEAAGQLMWTHQPHQQHVLTDLPVIVDNPKDFQRHNSFGDTGSVDGNRRKQHSFPAAPAHRFVPRNVPPRRNEMDHHNPVPGTTAGPSSFDHVRPFTFDPLFVEDPLSSGNNVGRNAFRINQVQRAFSDAHRALVASLEWDIHSSADGVQVDYPLLKCLLHGDDIHY
jgi:DNA polymerase sigma